MKLEIFNNTNLYEAATNFFQQLGIKLNSNTAEALPTKDLLKNFYKDNEVFNSIKSTYFIGIIDDSVFQTTMFVDKFTIENAIEQGDKNYDGLMLFALELPKKPTRTEISEITRAFNRISQKMPVALVLKYIIENEAAISIAVSERFKYLQNWRQGEKAGKVIILRDIFTSHTHAGHQRILLDLVKPAGVTNYAQLHAQWLEVLDVNILNKKFFQELANWYFWAMDKVQFPDDIEKKKDVRNATNLIRLITRVIFIWFIKEKNLVPASLFNEKYLEKILKDFQKNKKSSNYYQAILQNLFFGTLNQKMDERDFAEDHNRTNKLDQGIKNKYRYPDKFNISKKEIIDLFKDIPFLNGGLFDCLDKFDEEKLEKGKKEQIFVDGFTRLESKQAIVSDYLFFGEETEVDLNETYGTRGKRYVTKGLIGILNSYKFTVAENTPIEEEIALDPELLGKVFENLLASYNPETQTTARKQTGSFYTPREIVNYMVDESLIEYLKQNLKSSSPDSGEVAQNAGGVNTPESEEVARSAGGVKNLNNLPHLKTFRKTLRNNLTPAEAKLWTLLKGKQLEGKKFRRQFSVANYILDFYCPSENLAIELDGQGHFEETQAQYDLERDLFLQYTGIKVLRFENKWVWDNPDGLIEEIVNNFGWKNKQPLSQPLADSSPMTGEQLFENKLRKLFSYNDEGNPLNSKETDELIEAINNAKILDPACGSGAFPMGVLHKMVYLLQKLDPGNVKWKAQQKEKIIGNQIKELEKDKKAIEGLSDKAVREKAIQAVDERLKEIDEIFESKNNFDDYARKLYLIENCIYGIDIQPIAVQISKLRFFISLIIDQDKNPKKENLGFRSLPNLETKFVAANTLISLEKPKLVTGDIFIQDTLNLIKEKSDQLKEIRHKYFNAKLRKDKLQFQSEDKKLRKEISEMLVKIGYTKGNAYNIASFDPYDQNHYANWFEPEWMFGNEVKDGFDVVIGNPPYIDIKGLPNEDVKMYFRLFKTAENRINLYSIFIEKGISLLNYNGILSFINPNSILVNESYKKIRKYIVDGVEKIIKLPDSVFEAATVETIILLSRKESKNKNVLGLYFSNNDKIDFRNLTFSNFLREEWKTDCESRFNIFGNNDITSLLKKIHSDSIPLENYVLTSLGITPYDKYKGHSEKLIKNREFHSDKKLSNQYVPLISGKNIHPFFVTNGVDEYLKYGEWLGAPREKKFFENPRIIVRQILSGNEHKIVAAYSESPTYFTQIGFSLISKTDDKEKLKFILALLNSNLISFYHKGKFLDTEKIVFQKILIANCKKLPIKEPKQNKPFITLVDQILTAKKSNPQADTSALEKQIDELVYKLYDLTEEEIAIIENSTNKTDGDSRTP